MEDVFPRADIHRGACVGTRQRRRQRSQPHPSDRGAAGRRDYLELGQPIFCFAGRPDADRGLHQYPSRDQPVHELPRRTGHVLAAGVLNRLIVSTSRRLLALALAGDGSGSAWSEANEGRNQGTGSFRPWEEVDIEPWWVTTLGCLAFAILVAVALVAITAMDGCHVHVPGALRTVAVVRPAADVQSLRHLRLPNV